MNASDARRVLDLQPEDGLREAKAAFRKIAKKLHPDHTPASPETLTKLADAIAAIRFLENANPIFFEIELTEDEARNGTLRALRKDGRSGVFKIPANTRSGDQIEAVGDGSLHAIISVVGIGPVEHTRSNGLSGFKEDFVRTSPAARFAGWLRKSHSAA